MPAFPYRRMLVLGVTGSGKSTVAERLAARLGLTYLELDALYWKPGWVESDRDDFRARVELATRAPGWTLAGNYRSVRDIAWPRAEAAVWLDYPFALVFGQLWRRTWKRWRTQELLWGTNREPLLAHLKLWSKESLFHWLVRTYRPRKREYAALFALPEFAHLRVFRFRHPRETETWEAGLEPA
jgi:adenylate kinase family enzyme